MLDAGATPTQAATDAAAPTKQGRAPDGGIDMSWLLDDKHE
jgi:hypothetical protein